ncbi:MAG: phytochelatin synthase family protein [Myxococcota bacterium]
MSDSTFYRRPLPDALVPFSSADGRALFREALALGGMEGWFPLAEHFHTQSEPAFCALGSLVVVLNALSIDPARPWKGPWRWYAEDLLDCCDPLDQVRARGLTLPRFACLARCNGVTADLKHAADHGVDTFRRDVAAAGAGGPPVITSFGRRPLGQTGDGHYSPVGGWHPEKDLVLVLDVARFKYPPFWVPLATLHAAMLPHDPDTGLSRGWVVVARDGTRDGQAYRIACENPGWRAAVGRLRDTLPALIAGARPASATELVGILAAGVPAEVRGLVVAREGAPEEVVAGLRASPLAARAGDDAAHLVLLALAAPDAAWGPLDARVLTELTTHREALPDAARAEVARLRAQLNALASL